MLFFLSFELPRELVKIASLLLFRIAHGSVPTGRLRTMRRNVVALLSSILPHLDLQGISYDTGDVDSILQQIIEANNL